MSATITGTKTYSSPLANKRLLILTATITSADDAITLTLAAHGVRTIYAVLPPAIESGLGANFATIQTSFSGLVITLVSKNAAGSTATSFGDVRIVCIVD